MRLKKTVLWAALAATLMLGGCAKNPADNVPAAEVKTPAAGATATPAEASTPSESETPSAQAGEGQVLALAEGTEIGFVGSKVTGSHEGGFKKVDGKVTLPGDDPAQATVELTIDMTSVYSDAEKLTNHLKSEDFFGIDQHPTATFKTSQIQRTDDGYEVTGDLTLKGITRTISFPALMSIENGGLAAQAEFSINRMDFNIKYPGKPDDLIREEVVVKFDLKAVPEA